MHMLAALDLATGKMFYRIRDRKRRPTDVVMEHDG
jgi:hypothetical protein